MLKLHQGESQAELNPCWLWEAAARPKQTARVIGRAKGGDGKKLEVYRQEVTGLAVCKLVWISGFVAGINSNV